MPEYKLRYESKKEKCVCAWDEVNKCWVAISRIKELPDDVKQQWEQDKEKSYLVIDSEKYRYVEGENAGFIKMCKA